MTVKEIQEGCRTIRRFTQDEVSKEAIDYALENARMANSAANRQPLYYIAVLSKEMTDEIKPLVKWAAALPAELGTPKENEQPKAFIVIVKREGASGSADIDLGIAAHTITASLYEKGYGTCMMGAINKVKIAELLGVPETDKVGLAIAVGKADCGSRIVEMKGDEFNYYLDGNKDYCVPKRKFEDIVSYR